MKIIFEGKELHVPELVDRAYKLKKEADQYKKALEEIAGSPATMTIHRALKIIKEALK